MSNEKKGEERIDCARGGRKVAVCPTTAAFYVAGTTPTQHPKPICAALLHKNSYHGPAGWGGGLSLQLVQNAILHTMAWGRPKL